MKSWILCSMFLVVAGCASRSGSAMESPATPRRVVLFDGKSFAGWDGNTNTIWRIKDGALTGGEVSAKVPHNEFLCTTRNFTNFLLHVQFRLRGTNGFVNGGVQFRSQRTTNPVYEMSGYQADMGDPEWWGCLYDESRRDKVLVKPDIAEVNKVLRRQEWNDYQIRCEGDHIQVWLNGMKTVDYTEREQEFKGRPIDRFGLIGLQVHGGGFSEACYRDIWIEELP